VKQYLFTIIVTAAITFVLTWAVWRLRLRFKLYPGIRERDVHTTPTPRLGGVAIFLGIVAAFAVSAANPFFQSIWTPPQTMWSILAAALLIAVIGVMDDLWDIDWMIKLGAQFLAAGIITVGGGLQILSLPFGDLIVVSSWLSITITMFAIVIVMNAVNFIDGLDGLVAGVCLISNGVFFAYSYIFTRDSGAPAALRRVELLHPLHLPRCGPHRCVPGIPAVELESGEALHGRLGCARDRSAHGDLGHRDHRADGSVRPGSGAPRALAARRRLPAHPASAPRRAPPAARLRARRAASDERRPLAVLPGPEAPAPPDARPRAPRPRCGPHLLRLDGRHLPRRPPDVRRRP